jgi:hypothetical protein
MLAAEWPRANHRPRESGRTALRVLRLRVFGVTNDAVAAEIGYDPRHTKRLYNAGQELAGRNMLFGDG